MTIATIGQSCGPVFASAWHNVHGCPGRRGQAASGRTRRSWSTLSVVTSPSVPRG